jgi:hypothetical protein
MANHASALPAQTRRPEIVTQKAQFIAVTDPLATPRQTIQITHQALFPDYPVCLFQINKAHIKSFQCWSPSDKHMPVIQVAMQQSLAMQKRQYFRHICKQAMTSPRLKAPYVDTVKAAEPVQPQRYQKGVMMTICSLPRVEEQGNRCRNTLSLTTLHHPEFIAQCRFTENRVGKTAMSLVTLALDIKCALYSLLIRQLHSKGSRLAPITNVDFINLYRLTGFFHPTPPGIRLIQISRQKNRTPARRQKRIFTHFLLLANTRSNAWLTMPGGSWTRQLVCPNGHSRWKQGLHDKLRLTHSALSERGGVKSGLVEP